MPRPRPGISIDAHKIDQANWEDRARCLGLDPDIFFPADTDGVDRAKAICASCAVRGECLEYALAFRERYGVWGGTSEHERRRIARARRMRSAA